MNISDQKIITGIKYFVKHTRSMGRTKLFKLLYFWDFMFFKKHGLSVTCLDYYTYPFGPVPQILFEQIKKDKLPAAWKKEIVFIEEKNEVEDGYITFKVLLKNPKIDFDWLSPYEQEMLETVAMIFRDSTAKEMTEITHLHNSPWDITKNKFGMNQLIDYNLAIDDESTLDLETVKEFFTIQKELALNGKFEPGANLS